MVSGTANGFCMYDGTLPGGIKEAKRLSSFHPVVVAHFFNPVRFPFAVSGYNFCRSLRCFHIDESESFKYTGTSPGGINTANRLSWFHPVVLAHFFILVRFPFATSGCNFCRSLRSFQIVVSVSSRYFGTLPAGIRVANRLS